MPLLKRLKEAAKKTARGFSLTTGIGLHGEEKEKFEKLKAKRKEERYGRDLKSYQRQAEIESLKTKIQKTKEARRPKPITKKRMGIMQTPSMFLDDFSPISHYRKQAVKKTKKKKKGKKKSKKKRKRVIEYY